MRGFLVEISVEKDGKIISLDTDDMQIYISQKKNGKLVRIFDIECDRPGGHPLGTLRTTSEFVGRDDDEKISMLSYECGKRIKAISNAYGEE